MQVIRSPKVYDVIVIGSGASGGMAGWNLTRQGVSVLMLDAGRRFNRDEFWTHVLPFEARERRARGEKPPQIYLDTQEQPYLTPPDQPFELIRVWGIGGKTNVWGRVSLRYSDLDFKAAERDGWEIPWPISYKDLAPYYDKVDQLIGVCGGDDDSDALPGSKFHQPPPNLRCGEWRLKHAAGRLGIPIVNIRRATLTRNHRGFPKCHFCGACGAGCDTSSFFNAGDYLVTPAMKTGKLEVRSNAVVARILVDKEGRASGVQYFDRNTKKEYQVRGKVIVVGASAIDSTRILLNSKSEMYPNGIGNGSGVIGKYLCEQVRVHVTGFLPELMGRETINEDGIGGEHIYLPRFNHRGPKRDYLRGYGIQFWGSGCQIWTTPGYAREIAGFGSDFKTAVRKRYPALMQLHPFGETLPRADNYVTVEGTPTDKYGVPLPKIVYSISDNERKMVAEMYDTCEMILKEAKAEIVEIDRSKTDTNGSAIHEHGTCRMGDDPKRSALNKFNQMHEVKNVFVVDGSSFPSASEKNPTLTILAIAWRATDYLAEQLKKRNL
ncbi:MAG TPA: GMC family oxidoreductase [Blastocatellia bacterium]|nr:GMC family oxidoreductase [Blastocatellia bacterium]